jgi:hypothetical protein
MIRLTRYGRLLTVFSTSARITLISSWRLRWRMPKIIFLVNRYVLTSFILCVMCIILVRIYGNFMREWQAVLYPWVLHYVGRSRNLRIITASVIYPVGLSVNILCHKLMCLLFNMIAHRSCTSCLIVVSLRSKPYASYWDVCSCKLEATFSGWWISFDLVMEAIAESFPSGRRYSLSTWQNF